MVRFKIKNSVGGKEKAVPTKIILRSDQSQVPGAHPRFRGGGLSYGPFCAWTALRNAFTLHGEENVVIFSPKRENGGVVFSENVVWREALRKFGVRTENRENVGCRIKSLFLGAEMSRSGGVRHADLDSTQFEE